MKRLYDLAAFLLEPVPVIWAYGNGKQPPRPFAMLKVDKLNALPVHHGKLDNDGNRKDASHRITQMEIQVFGDSKQQLQAMQTANQAAMKAVSYACEAFCDERDVSVLSVSSVDNVPEWQDDLSWQPRAIVRLNVAFTSEYDDVLPVIDVANVQTAVSTDF